MIKAIIFDLYGVLAINGWQAFKQHHFANNQAAWRQLYELGRQVDAGLSDYEDFIATASQLTGVAVEEVRRKLECTLPNTELLAYIAKRLKPNYKIGILSNANVNVIERILSPTDQAMLDAVILSYHVGFTKPDAGMYRAIAVKLDVPLEECLFVDDQPRHCDGARAVGMRAILYKDFDQFKAEIQKELGPLS